MFGGGGAASVSPRPAVFGPPRHFKPTASLALNDENLEPRARVPGPTHPVPPDHRPRPLPISQPFGGGGTPAFGAQQPQSSVSTHSRESSPISPRPALSSFHPSSCRSAS